MAIVVNGMSYQLFTDTSSFLIRVKQLQGSLTVISTYSPLHCHLGRPLVDPFYN